MDKVLVIIPDSNKGKYITKGYSRAFKELSYFVIEKKVYDLNLSEIININPHIIFVFWNGIINKAELVQFLSEYKNNKTVKINLAELNSDIPDSVSCKTNSYNFSYNAEDLKYSILPSVYKADYKRKFTGYRYVITFAGNPAIETREKILSTIIYNFGIINIFCRSYDFYKSLDDIYKKEHLNNKYIDLYRESYRGYVETQEELSDIYSHSKINIDMPSNNDKPLNYRAMEITASGGFLILPYNKTVSSVFEIGKEAETYENKGELIDKIRFYTKHTDISQMIAINGKKNVSGNHAVYDRLKAILKEIYGENTGSR